MNIISVYKKYPTNEDCLIKLEKERWGGEPKCAYCNSHKVNIRGKENQRRRRWFCNSCRRSFSATVNSIMHGTHLPLQKWFLAITLLVNAKKSISSHQLSRDLDIPVKTAYSLSQRIRKAMIGTQAPILQGIVEMDETYIGGKPRYKGTSKRGRGTDKMPVIGAVERGGRAYAIPMQNKKMTGIALQKFAMNHLKAGQTDLMTDNYRGYSKMEQIFNTHNTVNHSAKEYVRGNIHTNTIEGFWSHLKRAYYGQHHHYSKKYADLYIAEACFKYNNRQDINRNNCEQIFDGILGDLCTNS